MTLQTQTAETQAAPAQEPPASRPFKRPIKDVPLASLVLTKINVRKHKDKDVESLAATIRIVGLLQPIGVRSMSDGAYEVVFGERRTLAIRKLHNEGHPGTDMVPALILEEGDDAAAIAIPQRRFGARTDQIAKSRPDRNQIQYTFHSFIQC
ncbi:MAG: ParB/Srx family N-terminal domain-containing protein [Methylovulum sp.]|nr:ParB/Srx family N-terminal domain-containing protein [Methylovulum sp.]